jgi:hypothetical protein
MKALRDRYVVIAKWIDEAEPCKREMADIILPLYIVHQTKPRNHLLRIKP